jgi:uncharacterized protein YjbI with pentapeptide repeats
MKHLLVSFCLLFFLGANYEVTAFDQDDLEKLKVTGDCVSCDLSGADLMGKLLGGANLQDANLTGAILRGANLKQANLTGASLTMADLTGSALIGANLINTNLEGAILRGVELYQADLSGRDLTDQDLTGANLTEVNLQDANLTGAILRGANLKQANLTGANLTEVNLSGMDLTGVNLSGANLSRAVLYDATLTRARLVQTNLSLAAMKGAVLTGADLTGANLAGAVLSEVDLSGIDLTGTDLQEADLSGTNLTEVNLSGMDLTGANLSGANLSRAVLYDATLTRARLVQTNLSLAAMKGAVLTGADLTGANLAGANLSRVDLSGMDLTGVNLTGANLAGANLSRVDLSGMDLSGINLVDTILVDADLSGAVLSDVDLSGKDLTGVNLSGMDLSGMNLTGTTLIGSFLYDVRLIDVDLSESNLVGARLSGANLTGANFSGSNLGSINLKRSDRHLGENFIGIKQGGNYLGVTSFDLSGDTHYLTTKQGILYELKDEESRIALDFNDDPKFSTAGYNGGLLSVVSSNDSIYISYTTQLATDSDTDYWITPTMNLVVDEYSKTFQKVRTIVQIGPMIQDHHGGTLAFDRLGRLYLSVGDGGPQGDPDNHAQNLQSLRGKILRFDISRPNPKPEIVAYGLRNPWKISIDSKNRMFVGDCGYDTVESVYLIDDLYPETPYNLGWPVFEGTDRRREGSLMLHDTLAPIYEYRQYDHLGVCVIGGFFLDEPQVYLFGDFHGILRLLKEQKDGEWHEIHSQHLKTDIWSFGYDEKTKMLYMGGSKTFELKISSEQVDLLPHVRLCRTTIPNGTINNVDC